MPSALRERLIQCLGKRRASSEAAVRRQSAKSQAERARLAFGQCFNPGGDCKQFVPGFVAHVLRLRQCVGALLHVLCHCFPQVNRSSEGSVPRFQKTENFRWSFGFGRPS